MRTYTVTEYERDDYDQRRDNMTNQEAIELLERIQRGWLPDYNFTGDERDFEAYERHCAINYAISALKERIK